MQKTAECYLYQDARKTTKRWSGNMAQTLLVMKLTIFLLTAAFLNVSAHGISQTVSLTGKELKLEKVFTAIKEQTGYVVVYTKEILRNAKPVDIAAEHMPLDLFLDSALKGQSFKYSLGERSIFISPGNKAPVVTAKEALDNPPVKITGKVLGAGDQPLAGATITIKGSGVIAISDNEGNFTINAEPGQPLIVSYIGFVTKEIKINDGGPLTIQLTAASASLDETMVIGYGTTSRRASTGSVSKVKGEELTRQNTNNPLLALQGRAAGVAITNTTGGPGGNVKVQIRGVNSVAAGAAPLYIIDGVSITSQSLSKTSAGSVESISPLNSINAADIESIEILKDADATAIYGSRGSNGVMLITTKKARAGASKFETNFYTGAGRAAMLLKMLNTQQYLQLRKDAFKADGEDPTETSAPDLLLWDQNAYTNWPKYLYGNTPSITNVQSNLSGGDDKTRYLFGIGYYTQGTLLPGNEKEDRVNAHLNVEHTSADKKFGASFTTNLSSDRLKLLGGDLFTSYILPPNFPLYDESGQLTYVSSVDNPERILHTSANNRTTNVLANASLRYKLFKGLQLKTNVGFTTQQLKGNVQTPSISMHILDPNKNSSRFSISSYQSLSIEPQADYSTHFGLNNLSLMAGATFQNNKTEGNIIEGANFSTDLLLSDLNAAADIIHKENFGTQYKYASVFARATYNYDSRYFVNATFRRDGSSRFGAENRFGNFGALGLAWLISNESFVKNELPFLSYAKLRGSYGITGNDQISDYRYLETYASNYYLYNGMPGLHPGTTSNGKYGWEENRKLELALEAGLFDNRILLTTAWFRNRCGNQLVEYPLAAQSGFGSYQANLNALLQNKGMEFELSTRNIETRYFSWTTSANISFIRNKLLEFPNLEFSPYEPVYQIGQPVTIWWGYGVNGIDPENGHPLLVDLNNDGVINYANDYVNLGSSDPRFFGGITNNFKYKGFELDVFFQFSEQNAYNWHYVNYYSPGTMNNVPALYLDNYWKQKGDQAKYPGLTASPASELYDKYFDYWFSNAAFSSLRYMRLKNLMFSWSLPESWIKKLKMNKCKVYIQGQNLLTFSSEKGLDPESALTTPIMKTITAGFQISF